MGTEVTSQDNLCSCYFLTKVPILKSLYVYPMLPVKFPSLLQFSGINISNNLWGKGLVSKDYCIETRGDISFLNYRTFSLLFLFNFLKYFLLQNYFLFVCISVYEYAYMCGYLWKRKNGTGTSWSWTYGWLRDTQSGYWELSLIPPACRQDCLTSVLALINVLGGCLSLL